MNDSATVDAVEADRVAMNFLEMRAEARNMPDDWGRMLNLTAVNSESWTNTMPLHWHCLRTPAASGAFNMAFDSAMMSTARSHGCGIWRCYSWDQPTISFGRNETVRGRFDAHSVARANLQAVRRPTGGRALLHAAEITYSVAVPIADHVAWKSVYAAVNHVLLAALRSLGVPSQLATDGQGAPLRPDGPACFDQPAPGEITVHGRKLVGSAVWRERGVFLQHGSILLEDHQSMLAEAMVPNATRIPTTLPPASSLATCLEVVPTRDAVESALEDALFERHRNAGGHFNKGSDILIDTVELHALETHYQDANWLWRR